MQEGTPKTILSPDVCPIFGHVYGFYKFHGETRDNPFGVIEGRGVEVKERGVGRSIEGEGMDKGVNR